MTPLARAKPRRNETRELVMPIMAALNELQGVRVWRPHVLAGSARDIAGAGLAVGSADLIGLVQCPTSIGPDHFGRFLALEVKWPGKRATYDQLTWARVVLDLGGFWAEVHSIDEARAAVERCKMGERD